jgi:hypothetical protein
MNTEEQNFDSLQKLLKLKRHEQPPPRYFNEFSGRVIARIEAAEQAGGSSSVGDWFSRLLGGVEARSAFMATFGLAACVLFLSGLVLTEAGDAAPGGMYAGPSEIGVPDLTGSPAMALNEHAFAGASGGGTNDSIHRPSLFDQIGANGILPNGNVPASYPFGGN